MDKIVLDRTIMISEESGNIIYAAYNTNFSPPQQVVVKRLRSQDEFNIEEMVLKGLLHENIIKYYLSEVKRFRRISFYYLVLEYIEGLDFHTYIFGVEGDQYNFPSVESLFPTLIGQVLSALEYLHQRNIVHCDIKLENIMYDRKESRFKLIDFGSCVVGREVVRGTRGTPGYISPELRDGRIRTLPHLTKSDIWSLGVSIYVVVNKKFLQESPGFPIISSAYQKEPIRGIINDCLVDNYWNRLSATDLLRKYFSLQSSSNEGNGACNK